jgi:hypothetical protein
MESKVALDHDVTSDADAVGARVGTGSMARITAGREATRVEMAMDLIVLVLSLSLGLGGVVL